MQLGNFKPLVFGAFRAAANIRKEHVPAQGLGRADNVWERKPKPS
jgi:hypothetical protein